MFIKLDSKVSSAFRRLIGGCRSSRRLLNHRECSHARPCSPMCEGSHQGCPWRTCDCVPHHYCDHTVTATIGVVRRHCELHFVRRGLHSPVSAQVLCQWPVNVLSRARKDGGKLQVPYTQAASSYVTASARKSLSSSAIFTSSSSRASKVGYTAYKRFAMTAVAADSSSDAVHAELV
eukprot:1485454-Pyramimonas_sp.AAC.2